MKHHFAVRSFTGLVASLALAACGGGGDGGNSSPQVPAPTVSISISPSDIAVGQPTTLTWSSTNASTCTASDAWTGPQDKSGSLNVSPPASGTYTYTLSCAASGASAATASTTLTVTSESLAITTATLANGVVGTAYTDTIQATGGAAPFSWTVSSGTLPGGLAVSDSTTNTVTVSGTPQAVAQGVAFTIEVADSAQHVASQAYTVSILPKPDSLVLSPTNLDFGNEIVGITSANFTELTNTATSPIAIANMAVTGLNAAEFSLLSSTCGTTLGAGASCTANVGFTPVQTGPRSAALTIIDDTAGSPHAVSLNGTGIMGMPNATLSVSDLNFSTQLVGTTSPALTVTLNNYGTGPLSVSQVTATASFAETGIVGTNDCVLGVPPGAYCYIRVTFTPGASGVVTGTLSITDDAPGSPQTVSLTGTGSTSTPLLTGYCVGTVAFSNPCRITRTFTSRCPQGQSAQHPIKRQYCTSSSPPVMIDGQRNCITAETYSGNCEAR